MDQHSDTSTVCLNSAQDVIISFCSDPSGPSQLGNNDNPDQDYMYVCICIMICNVLTCYLGSINISNIFSGELLGKVDYDSVMNSQRLTSYDQNTSRQALAGVTCLVYNEQSHHIYTGHEDGTVHVWSC